MRVDMTAHKVRHPDELTFLFEPKRERRGRLYEICFGTNAQEDDKVEGQIGWSPISNQLSGGYATDLWDIGCQTYQMLYWDWAFRWEDTLAGYSDEEASQTCEELRNLVTGPLPTFLDLLCDYGIEHVPQWDW